MDQKPQKKSYKYNINHNNIDIQMMLLQLILHFLWFLQFMICRH